MGFTLGIYIYETKQAIGTEHGLLRNEAKRLWHFVKGADNIQLKLKKRLCLFRC